MNRKDMVVDTGMSTVAAEKDGDSEVAGSPIKAAELKLQSQFDVMCSYLELLDAVSEGDFQWSDGATTLNAVKRPTPSSSKKGP